MTHDEAKALVASMPQDELKMCYQASYLPFLVCVVYNMCQQGTFPRSAKKGKAWRAERAFLEIGARAALHPDAVPPLRDNVANSERAARGQWGNICRCIAKKFGDAPTDMVEFIIVTDTSFGFYCTNNRTDINVERMYNKHVKKMQGHKYAANVFRRPDQLGVDVEQKLIPFIRRRV
jgi:hypothetical protein